MAFVFAAIESPFVSSSVNLHAPIQNHKISNLYSTDSRKNQIIQQQQQQTKHKIRV